MSKDRRSWFHSFDKVSSGYLEQISLYILSSYYVVTTVTTVGFGDVVPKDGGEQIVIMGYQVKAF